MDQSNACKAYISLSRLRALLILATLQTRLADTHPELAEDLNRQKDPARELTLPGVQLILHTHIATSEIVAMLMTYYMERDY